MWRSCYIRGEEIRITGQTNAHLFDMLGWKCCSWSLIAPNAFRYYIYETSRCCHLLARSDDDDADDDEDVITRLTARSRQRLTLKSAHYIRMK